MIQKNNIIWTNDLHDRLKIFYTKCNIIIVTNNSINYKINDDTLMHHISKRSVESFYITDSIKRCLLTPNKCHDINPPIYSNNKSYNNNSIYLIFKTPITKIDSLNIDLKYTKFCLLKYKKESLTGIYIGLSGLIPYSIGITSGNIDVTKVGIITGSVFELIGTILFIDSFKWLKRSGNNPFLEPYGNGVCIRF